MVASTHFDIPDFEVLAGPEAVAASALEAIDVLPRSSNSFLDLVGRSGNRGMAGVKSFIGGGVSVSVVIGEKSERLDIANGAP